jgi:D-alanyl-D-alanine dipeptidase
MPRDFSQGQLVAIADLNKNIRIECMYATARNFTGKQIYSMPLCALLYPIASQLSLVQQALETAELGLLVWDAYRPLSAQHCLWNACPDSRYVAPPDQGGRHTRGTAVDVTLVHIATGAPLDMGTAFDDFTANAHYTAATVSAEARANRKTLRDAMIAHGFEPYDYEWWHFDYQGWQRYPVLSIELESIR